MKEQYAIEMCNITKIFNKKVIANDNINLKIKKGEIHALLGENGAGKSTLMSILSGVYKPTFGKIIINGKEVIIQNSSEAKKLGIGMIYQHFKLVENFTVLENIALCEDNKSFFLDKKDLKKKVSEILDKYNFKIDLNKKISDLPVADLQKIEIIKVLINNIDIFVFDEPTAVLLKSEIEQFLKILKNLKDSGKTIIFISHKLQEIKELSDNISIIRNGKLIDTFPTKSKTIKEMANLMIGREVEISKTNHKVNEQTVLKISDLNLKEKGVYKLKNINIEIKSGEILGIAGVSDNGQTELLEAITGIKKHFKGNIYVNEIDITKMPTHKIYEYISYIPEDRIKNGIVLNMNILDNVLLQNLFRKPFSNKAGLLNKESNVYYSQEIIRNYDVRGTDNGYALADNLSGGNQQKLIVGREIEKPHQVLLISNPTRGVDLGAIEYIHKKILEEKSNGQAILLASTELEELMTLSDRIIIMSSGAINGELTGKKITKENIGILMLDNKEGISKDDD